MQNGQSQLVADAKSVVESLADVNEEAKLSSSDQVVEHINRGILDGRLVPGQRLIESDLTRSINVSRGPVREAFRRLDAVGVLARTMHRGAYIRVLAKHEATDLLLAIEPLTGLIAFLAADQVARRKFVANMAPVEEALKPYRDREEDAGDVLSQRRHFWETLMIVGGNSQLPSLLPTMRIHLLRLQINSFMGSDDRRRHLDEYAQIATAVLAGEAKRAEKLACQHMKRMRQAIAELPDAAFPYFQPLP